jgi:hypothetical protein
MEKEMKGRENKDRMKEIREREDVNRKGEINV